MDTEQLAGSLVNDERYQLDATIMIYIINNSTCFRHLYVHLQECRLCAAACGVQHQVLWVWSQGAGV